MSRLFTATIAFTLALTFSCTSGDGSNGSGSGTSKSSCISAELEIKANTLDDVAAACNAIRSEVLAQLPDRIGSCNKSDLAFDKSISELTASCGVTEIPATSSSSFFSGSSSSRNSSSSSSSYVACGAYNSSTQYCSDGTIKTYGTVSDGVQNYKTVVIGEQTWMAENLNYDVPVNDTDICYDNDPANCNTYGRLYNWATAMALPTSCNTNFCSDQIQQKHQGICPNGWHIPSDSDWTTLVDFVGGASIVGRKLKATSGWYNNGNGEDSYGFSALPGGTGFSGVKTIQAGKYGVWWKSSEGTVSIVGQDDWYRTGEGVYRYDDYGNKVNYLCSVRCLQD